MERQDLERGDERSETETPADVAVLYSWANLHGARYRDFSASRREYRAQMRHRAAEQQREAEQSAKAEAEAAAAAAEKAAHEAEDAARFHAAVAKAARESGGLVRGTQSEMEEAARVRAMRAASEMARKASIERIEVARRAEAVAAAEAAARREANEVAEAHASALRQTQRYEEAEMRRRRLAGPQPTPIPGGEFAAAEVRRAATGGVPALTEASTLERSIMLDEDMSPARYPQVREGRTILPPAYKPNVDVSGFWPAGITTPDDAALHDDELSDLIPPPPPLRSYESLLQERRITPPYIAGYQSPASVTRRPQGYRPNQPSGEHRSQFAASGSDEVPAWIYSSPQESGRTEQAAPEPSPLDDTLLHSRQRVASRWFALKGIFEQGVPDGYKEPVVQRAKDARAPMLMVFSLAGGVGKTSLVATLGRTLSSSGEKVLLTDATSHGLLPFYFGASELRPGVVRTFSPPLGSMDAPIYLVSYDVHQKANEAAGQDWFLEELSKNGRGMQRILLDLTPGSAWLARRFARMNATILVPVNPDMNSVISLTSLEKLFAGLVDDEGRLVQPYYLLNQFDSALPLHLDIREVMRQKLGDRLLPFVIRRAPAVSEALAEGMTVMDYAPEAPVAGDYLNLAAWLRTQSAPASASMKNARWSEQ